MHDARNAKLREAPAACPCRSYHSPFRQQRADATRQRILDAAARCWPNAATPR